MKADIIAGIPSYNEEKTVALAAKRLDEGLVKYFPEKKCLIVNVDNRSPDGTKEAFLGAETKTKKLYLSTAKTEDGKGRVLRELFNLVSETGAEAAMTVDADVRSATPEWPKNMLSPVLDGKADFVFPDYARHPRDGTLTNNVCYPLVYGLLGKDIRQPIGGDFGFSRKLSDYWLAKEWSKETKNYGIDIFMTLNAVFGEFKITSADLGVKIHNSSAPKLDAMFSQVVSATFKIILENKEFWRKPIKKVEEFRARGAVPEFSPEKIPAPETDGTEMRNKADEQFLRNEGALREYLSPETFFGAKLIFAGGGKVMDAELWARMVSEIMRQFDKTKFNPSPIEALKPLYFARVLAFMEETENLSPEKTEALVRKQAEIFFKTRELFI